MLIKLSGDAFNLGKIFTQILQKLIVPIFIKLEVLYFSINPN